MIEGLLSSDENVRKQAEVAYNASALVDPFGLVSNILLPTLNQNQSLPKKQLALVLLRKIVKTAYVNFNKQQKEAVKGALLQVVANPTGSEEEKHGAIHCFVSIPPQEIIAIKHDLVHLAVNLLKTDVKTGLFFLDKLAEFSPEAVISFSTLISEAIVYTINAAGVALDVKLLACLTATSLVLCEEQEEEEEEEENARNAGGDSSFTVFASLEQNLPALTLPLVAQGLVSASQKEQATAEKVLENFQTVIESKPYIFDANLSATSDFLLQIMEASSERIAASGKALAMGVLTEVFKRKGKAVVQDAEFLNRCLRVVFKLQLEDEEFENDFDVEESVVEDDLFLLSQSGTRGAALVGLAELCLANSSYLADAKKLTGILFEFIKPLLGSARWTERFAAFGTIAVMAGPLEKGLLSTLNEIGTGALATLENDPDLNVKYAALACLKCMLDCPILGRGLHKIPNLVPTVCKSLLNQLNGAKNMGLITAELCVLNSFFEEEKFLSAKTNVSQHLNDVVQTLILCVNVAGPVQAKALHTLSRVATCASGANFHAYYDLLLPGLKAAFANAGDPDLSCAAMVCLASVAESVGREKFSADAEDILGSFFQRQAEREQANKKDETQELEGLFEFIRRVSLVLKSDFKKFVPYVLPLALRSAMADLEIKVTESDQAGEAGNVKTSAQVVEADDDTGVTTTQVSQKGGAFNITANVYAFQLRSSSIRAMDAICEALGEEMNMDDVDACVAAIIPNIADRACTTTVNSVAAEASGSVFHAAALVARADNAMIPRCVRVFVSLAAPLLVGLGYESSQPFEVTESERRDAFAAAFERMIRICYNSGDYSDLAGGVRGNPIILPPHDVVEKMIQVILEALKLSMKRRVDAAGLLSNQGFEAQQIREFEQEVLEGEVEFASDLVDGLGWMLKTDGSIWPVWKAQVLPFFAPRVSLSSYQPMFAAKKSKKKTNKSKKENSSSNNAAQVDKALVHNALCVFVDSVEFCPVAGDLGPLANGILPALAEALEDDDPLLKQVAAYGVGVCAKVAPGVWMTQAGEVLVKMMNQISRDDEDQIDALENIISSLGKVAVRLERDDWISLWLTQLPLTNDATEGPATVSMLCDLILQNKICVLNSPDNVVNIFGKVLLSKKVKDEESEIELVDEETLQRIPQVLKAFKTAIGDQKFQQSIASMHEKFAQQAVLEVL